MKKSQPKPKPPPAPKHLSADAAEVWRVVVAYLAQAGRLAPIDYPVICGYAMAVSRQNQLQAELDKAGVLDADGKPHPLLRSTEAVAASVKNFAHVLGLTPAARKSLPAKPTKSGDDRWRGVLD